MSGGTLVDPVGLLNRHAVRGVCGPTEYKERCDTGPSGAIALGSLRACKARCLHCAACNFISFSAERRDCSWYTECELVTLGKKGVAAVSSDIADAYLTFDMRDTRREALAKLLMNSPPAPVLAPDFAILDAACGPSAALMSIAACPEQVAWYANATWSLAHASSEKFIWGCETGFNCGHSSMTFLAQDPRIQMISFDKAKWNFSKAARTVMKRTFGKRFELVVGDSREAIPAHFEALEQRRKERCDFIHVDGGHLYAIAILDVANFFRHARCGALVLMDDVCDTKMCATVDKWAIGPSRAWAELQRLGLVRETGRGMRRDEVHPNKPRLWVAGRVLCREKPARRPTEVKLAPHLQMSRNFHQEWLAHAQQDSDGAAAATWQDWPQ